MEQNTLTITPLKGKLISYLKAIKNDKKEILIILTVIGENPERQQAMIDWIDNYCKETQTKPRPEEVRQQAAKIRHPRVK